MDTHWKHPFAAIIAGPSSCGKTQFVLKFLKYLNEMCDTKFSEIIWYYSEWQHWYSEYPYIQFEEGLPPSKFPDTSPRLIIIDDLMREADGKIVDLFTKGCHHKNISIFFITQNIFHQGKGQRDISLNAHYIVYFKNPRDKAQILHLARQVSPEDPKFLQEAYNDATSEPHGYLMLDLKQSTPDEIRFRTKIFPCDEGIIVYVPKK